MHLVHKCKGPTYCRHKLVRFLVVPVEVGQELGGGAGGVERHGGEPGGAGQWTHLKPLLKWIARAWLAK